MAYTFNPIRPTPLKQRIYDRLKTISLARKFLDWCTYSKIISKDVGLASFTPNEWFDAQWKFVETLCTHEPEVDWFVFLKGRQLGISTVADQWDLFYNFRYPNLQSAVVSADYLISNEMRATIRTIYDNLPIAARIPKKQDNSVFMSFRNNSRIKFFYTTGKVSKRGNMGRSGANNYVHGTEVAYFLNLEDYNAFTNTLSQTYPHRLYIWESTANQYNHFYDMWETAKESNTQKAIFLAFWMKETYRIDEPRELQKYGYDPVQWEQENIDLVKKLYGYELTINQLAWWRKNAKEKVSDRGMMAREDVALQEHPFTEHDAFRLSGKSFFQSRRLQQIQQEDVTPPIRCIQPLVYSKPELTEFRASPVGKVKIWEEFDPGAQYILGADPSYGANPDSDNAVIEVYKCFKDKIIQVVEYADNAMDTFHFTWILISLAGMWAAPQIIEVNGPGRTVMGLIDMYKRWIKDRKEEIPQKLSVYEYAKRLKTEYLYHRPDTLNSSVARQWLTTPGTKKDIYYQFQSCVHNGEVLIKSQLLLKEMDYVTQNGDDIRAVEGKEDDRPLASALCCEFWMRYFRTRLPTLEDYEKERALREKDKTLYDNPQAAFMRSWARDIISGNVTR